MGDPARRSGELWQPASFDRDGTDRDGYPDDGDGLAGGGGRRPALDLTTGRGDLVAGLACLLAMIVAGPLLGLLWAATAPRLDVRAVLAGSEAAFNAQGGVDAYFGLIFLVGGIIGGLLALWRGRDASWPVPVGLAVGGFGGSLLAGLVGHALRTDGARRHLPPGAGPYVISLVDFKLRAHGLYVVMPTAAVTVLAIGLWLTTHARPREPDLGPADQRPHPD